MLNITVPLAFVCPFLATFVDTDESPRMSMARTGSKVTEYVGCDAADDLEYSDEIAMTRLDCDRAIRSVEWSIEAE